MYLFTFKSNDKKKKSTSLKKSPLSNYKPTEVDIFLYIFQNARQILVAHK